MPEFSATTWKPPHLTELGSMEDITRGTGQTFPDTCDLATGSVVGADPCSGQAPPGGGPAKP